MPPLPALNLLSLNRCLQSEIKMEWAWNGRLCNIFDFKRKSNKKRMDECIHALFIT